MQLPHPIQEAFDRNIEYITDEYCEWKLEIEDGNDYLVESMGSKVLVIGNNGYGDYLVLKIAAETSTPQLPLYIFWHEGPEINQVKADLECYLGLLPYPPSATPVPTYHDGSAIGLGDEVEFTSFFRRKNGTVTYITGISPLDHKIETPGIPSIEIKLPNGDTYGITASQKVGRLRKSINRVTT